MSEWLNNNWVEIIGAVFALIYLILEIRQQWMMWIVGIISSAFYVYIFHNARLYAETGLNVYYAIMSVYGLYCWKFIKIKNSDEPSMKHLDSKTGLRISIIAFITFGIMSYILIRFTDSPVPYPDALIAALSIVATWMVAKKIIEHWYIWIFTNFFSVSLYLYQKLYPTALLFIIYGSMSVVGLIQWRKSINQTKQI